MKSDVKKNGQGKRNPVRYAVVGLGHIAQVAVLPAFANAQSNSELTALVSDDPKKLKLLSRRYHAKHMYNYDEYEVCLRSGEIDAVYIALPNNLHCEFAVRAANAGVHVLCEKPLALNEAECQEIIEACTDNGVKLMTAYRLHFDRANLEAIRLVQSGKIGEPRIFNSLFTMQVKEGISASPGDSSASRQKASSHSCGSAHAVIVIEHLCLRNQRNNKWPPERR